ncbi:MAG: hypothetical protein ACMUIE_01530 [Thermoplasmatota archaeon]
MPGNDLTGEFMQRSDQSLKAGTALLVALMAAASLILVAGGQGDAEPTRAYPSKMNLATIVPYHPIADGDTDLTGEACLSMVFDYWGPYVPQQNIRNVTKGRLGSGIASMNELIRASHFSDQSFYTVNQRGYPERSLGYGGFLYDWTDDERNPSPRSESRFPDIYEAIAQMHPIMALMYLDIPPTVTTPGVPTPPDPTNPQPPDPPEPQVTPEDLAALEKVWRLVVGYDTNTGQMILHDPLPSTYGFGGGKEIRIGRDVFDRMWNVYMVEDGGIRTHRYGMTAAPWQVRELEAPRSVEAGTVFQVTANITYNAPPVLSGAAAENSQAILDIPEDFSIENSAPNKPLTIGGPRSYNNVAWDVRAPDKSYVGQDIKFHINASGIVTGSEPAHRDRIGCAKDFEVEAIGFLNHPPIVNAADVQPAYVPDDGSVQPIITCIPFDEDGNLLQVTVDLSAVGGSPTQKMYDNGDPRYGDEVDDDGTYSYLLRSQMPVGEWTFMITARDSKGGLGYGNVTIRVDPISEFTEAPEFKDAGVFPQGVPNDGFTPGTIWAIIEDQEDDVERVSADLSAIGGDDDQKLYDDGSNGDLFSKDGNWSFTFTVDPLTPLDKYQIEIRATDTTGHESMDRIWLDVILPPVPPVITEVSPNPETVVNDDETKVVVTAIVEDDNDDVVEVTVDLSPVGGRSSEMMRDDGISPDSRAGDDMWTVEFTVPDTVSTGMKGRIDVTAVDSAGFSDTKSFSLTVEKANSPPDILDYRVSKFNVKPGDQITVEANLTDPDLELLDALLILTELNMSDVPLTDDGEAPDREADDMTFTGSFRIPDNAAGGSYNITLEVIDPAGAKKSVTFKIEVMVEEEGADEASLPLYLFIGGPSAGLLVLILLLGFVYYKKSRPSGQPAPGFRPMPPPGAGPRAPPLSMRGMG